MPIRSSLWFSRFTTSLFALGATCSGTPPPQSTTPAEVVAVPLTAATVSIASSGTVRDEIVPPWSLTASDGSGLLLTKVEAKAVFEGPLAFTELHLYFHNPEDRRREGTFQITLPQNAAVSRFAMENDGKFMEAEVVEKMIARRAYDDFLHRRQDPALLEKAAGNQFTAKVFPIPAKADKHIVISYSQELPGAQYMLPLRGLPKIEHVQVSLGVTGADGKHTEQRLDERNWQPDRDFTSSVTTSAAALAAGNVVAAQVTVFDGAVIAEAPKGVTLLVDTSASRALGYASYVASVRTLVTDLRTRYGDALPVQVVAFDQDTELLFTGRVADFGDAAVKKLLERGAAGASDLGQAFASISHQSPEARVVVVTDGVITAGSEGAALAAKIAELKAVSVDRLDVVLAGGLRDEKAATALVRAGLPHTGAVLDLDTGVDQVAQAIGEPVSVDLAVEVPGASWVYPRTITSARPGTHAMIYAKLAQPKQTLEISIAGHQHTIATLSGTQPLVERAVAAAEIEDLEAKLANAKPDERAALRTQIAHKSVASRVVSSETSMLVLESDADYARYGINRTSLADVLVVGANGIERLHRKMELAQPMPVTIASPQTREKAKKTGFKDDAVALSTGHGGKGRIDDGDIEKQADEGGEPDKAMEAKPEAKADVSTESFDRRSARDMGPGAAAGSSATAMRPPTSQTQPPPPPPRPEPAPARPMSPRAVAPADQSRSRVAGDNSGEALEQRDHNQSTEAWPPKDAPVALTGDLAAIEQAIAHHDIDGALGKARDWHARAPGDVLALIGLGDALEAKGSTATAARVYGSIIDLFPGRADMRRFAGERLERVGTHQARLGGGTRSLVIDTYRRAVEDRPDHVTGHRLLAYALLRQGDYAEAFAAIIAGLDQPYPSDRFAGADRVLGEDAGMIGAAYAAHVPGKRGEIEIALARHGGIKLPTTPSTRFILYWETDANDVDFHIQDAHGGHAYYASKALPSGGELYADITTGYGPECFTIQGQPHAGPYRLSINYYSQGPMGFGMGLLQVQRFDGKGNISIEDRPYEIMNDHAFVELGTIQ
ncbi:MAG: hypothetical protein JWO36_38 [Myxococcales bacterium]|nr:hypothetical protein [Myxococcales bacterium]